MSSDNEYMRQYMAARRARRRTELMTILGNQCARCGETEDLDFDHVIPGSQSLLLSGPGLDKPWAVLLAEIAKCQLLCKPCHRAKSKECGETGGGHNKITEHGTEAYFLREKCRCDPCMKARREARMRRGESKGVNRYGGRGRYGTVEHGGGLTGKHSCKCGPCKARKAEYARNKRSRMVKSGITADC